VDRYIVREVKEDHSWHDHEWEIWDTVENRQIASDAMEPEDALFVRGLSWIAPLLNSQNDELSQLRKWKESAMAVLGEWDTVHKLLGAPGLGESKAITSLEAVKKLKKFLKDSNRGAECNAKVVDSLAQKVLDQQEKIDEFENALRSILHYAKKACDVTSVEYGRTDWFQVHVDVAENLLEKHK
jgi:hypothetical protein